MQPRDRIRKWLIDMQTSIIRIDNIAITDARKIVNLRNLIIHSYDSVSDEIIWAVIHKNLPNVAVEIQTLLDTDFQEMDS